MVSVRNIKFLDNAVYHVFNRGVERRSIFTNIREYERFILLLEYYRVKKPQLSFSHYITLPLPQREVYQKTLANSPLTVEILAYCLMPNHFHLLLKQKLEGGIIQTLSKISNGYAKYFNIKNKRVGPLFQGPFKAVCVETDEQVVHLSRYIHINPVVSGIISLDELFSYKWSSLPAYLDEDRNSLVTITTEAVLGHFQSADKYKKFLLDQIAYAKELEKVKHLILEEV